MDRETQPIKTLTPIDRLIQDLISKKDYAQANRLIQERLKKEPKSAEAHYWLGILNYFQGNVGKTVESLKKSLRFDPNHTDAAICLSVLLNDIGKYDEAKQIFQQANQSIVHKRNFGDLKIDKKFSVKHIELADLYFRYRRYDEAIEEYTKAARLDPLNLEIRLRRGRAFAKKGLRTRAIQELQQVKKEYPHYLPARLQLGMLHYSQGNILDAELEWESIVQLEPEHKEARNYLAMAQKARQNPTLPRNPSLEPSL